MCQLLPQFSKIGRSEEFGIGVEVYKEEIRSEVWKKGKRNAVCAGASRWTNCTV
jgi:hypothetical protein